MDADLLYRRYQELQQYVGWTTHDATRVHAAAPLIEPHFRGLVDDFYAEIERHPEARKVITGGQHQIDRLKGTLIQWLQDLFSSRYDARYVAKRWRAGSRHVEIGLDQVYTNVALSRLRHGLHRILEQQWGARSEKAGLPELMETLRSLDKLLDLDLAIIEDAYQAEYLTRRERAERLAAIGQVAGGIAHELRNPLNVIKTSVYYLLNARNASSEKRIEHLTRIEKQVGLADGVIGALSNFARMPLPQLRTFPIEPWLRETLDLMELPAHIDIDVDCPEDLPLVVADPEQLRIVVSNLIRNALDAMPDGGQIFLGAAPHPHGIELTVRDTGQGIPPEDLHRIMEPLYTTKARGIGLGLAIARAIVDKNGARLGVQSRLVQGTTFSLQLRSLNEEPALDDWPAGNQHEVSAPDANEPGRR